ncbi:IS110 family RNA-guided transposase [Enterococcus faecalis]|uniref:IS110 family transposase n=1 Tax=Enterococcus faecalis TaxID=1351 RepID=UPI000352D494|nr:IS110 family transposase [Enterococcus faecalis]EPH71353.1 transposase, IS116/IS110/IS902 family [Enterococcus faecalis 20-SD-BW-06]EPI03078.1 transposase, IS116/IS110/IS902 family [Enterococcus faecalis 20-SD-BW-08]
MNAVGIDVSKGKSMISVMRPLGEIVANPFEIFHTPSELDNLANYLKSLDGETKIVMEYTGKYHQPISQFLIEQGFFVSIIHAKLIHDFGNNSIRKVKTDKADAIKIANYGLANWQVLSPQSREDEIRTLLKGYNRQYNQYSKTKVALKNNLNAILDQTFMHCNSLFSSPRKPDGHEKWLDFTNRFWHCECVTKYSLNAFIKIYNSWCRKNNYYQSSKKATEIYELAQSCLPTLPYNKFTKELVQLAIRQVNELAFTLAFLQKEMNLLASTLPEYSIVLNMGGVGETLGPQLMAEIGDIQRFAKKQSLVAFSGVDAPPHQSGKFEAKSRRISKRGSGNLRKTLFQVMICLLQNSLHEDPVYQFLDRKRQEGKHYYVYMVAGCNKFLRIYYARVKEYLLSKE